MASAAVLLAASLSACMPAIAQVDETADPALAAAATAATAPARAYQVVFDWTLRERDARFTGQGSARIAPPYRARLDLFGPRGETYMAAALVDTDLRLAAAADAEGELPPAELLWSVLGVFHAPANATLIRTVQEGTSLRLEYADGNQRWRYRFADGRLVHAEWEAGRASRRSVELRGTGALGVPQQAVYRDWAEFRELNLTLREVHEADAFPPDIFVIGR